MHLEIFDAVFNRPKTRTVTRSLAWDTNFTVQSQNKAYKAVQKLSKNSVRSRGAVAPSPLYGTLHTVHTGTLPRGIDTPLFSKQPPHLVSRIRSEVWVYASFQIFSRGRDNLRGISPWGLSHVVSQFNLIQ